MPLRGISSRLRVVTALVGMSFLVAACSATGGSTQDIQPAELRGDPAVVALAAEILNPRVAALADVNYIQATCVRLETVAGTGAKHVSGGPLSIRRDPPSMLFKPSGTRNLQILENVTTRLVVDVSRRHATRWTYERNSRNIAGVAALMLDIDVLARKFIVESVGQFEDNSNLTQITFVPAPDVGLSAIERLEIVFSPEQDIPVGLRVISGDGGFIDYELMRPNLNPNWRDPDVHFRLVVPPGFKVAERQG